MLFEKLRSCFSTFHAFCTPKGIQMNRPPDIKALIHLNQTRQSPAASGYRPAHRIKDGYLTTGIHQYIDTDELYPGNSCEGTITFLTPEVYPNCLKVGQVIDIQEGARIVGTAEIIEIYNKLLVRLE